jgi:hypothetical protein
MYIMEQAKSHTQTESKTDWMNTMLYKLAINLSTPDGKRQFADVEALMQRVQSRREAESILDISLTLNVRNLYIDRPRRRLPLHYRVRDSRKARELMIFSDVINV